MSHFTCRYELATHSVKVRRSGTMMDVVSLSELFGKPSLPAVGSLITDELKARFLRLTSVDSFNMVTIYCLFNQLQLLDKQAHRLFYSFLLDTHHSIERWELL